MIFAFALQLDVALQPRFRGRQGRADYTRLAFLPRSSPAPSASLLDADADMRARPLPPMSHGSVLHIFASAALGDAAHYRRQMTMPQLIRISRGRNAMISSCDIVSHKLSRRRTGNRRARHTRGSRLSLAAITAGARRRPICAFQRESPQAPNSVR